MLYHIQHDFSQLLHEEVISSYPQALLKLGPPTPGDF